MDPPKISDDLCPFLLYLCLFYACTNTLVLAVELVPVMESLGTEELLGGHPVTIKLDQQREPVLRPTQVRWIKHISYFLLLFASKVGLSSLRFSSQDHCERYQIRTRDHTDRPILNLEFQLIQWACYLWRVFRNGMMFSMRYIFLLGWDRDIWFFFIVLTVHRASVMYG